MPRFKIHFMRRVVSLDSVERVIEAENLEQAQDIADGMIAEFDDECPDDSEEISLTCESWDWTTAYPTEEPVDA